MDRARGRSAAPIAQVGVVSLDQFHAVLYQSGTGHAVVLCPQPSPFAVLFFPVQFPQNRLVASWSTEASARADGLPGPVRAQFVAGFRNAAKSGLQVGAGQTGIHLRLPHGSAPGLLQRIALIGRDVFTHGFVDAMRWTTVMPVGMLLLAAATCLAITQRKRQASELPTQAAEAKTPAA